MVWHQVWAGSVLMTQLLFCLPAGCWLCVQGMCKHYVFVASAGAYKANNIELMHFEGDERKSSAGELQQQQQCRAGTCSVTACSAHHGMPCSSADLAWTSGFLQLRAAAAAAAGCNGPVSVNNAATGHVGMAMRQLMLRCTVAVLCCTPGHVAVERYLESEGLPFTVFQPLYIYGAHTAKDCEQWFIDRIIR
jgi:hypothetical protein